MSHHGHLTEFPRGHSQRKLSNWLFSMSPSSKIAFTVNTSAAKAVADRADRLASNAGPTGLDDLSVSVQFLRNLGSRCVFALSSFYLLLGTKADSTNRCSIAGFPGRVLQNQIHYSSLSTISLACRKAFDHGKGMTGAAFGRIDNTILKQHADHWARSSGHSKDDAYRALTFLRVFFRTFSKPPNALFKQGTTLGRRIGFVKQYADRSAAHISLEHYEYDNLDVAHLVAALVLVGSIIYTFDNDANSTYFNELDAAAFEAANVLFPDIPQLRLFERMDVAMQARWCWQQSEAEGIRLLAEQLPYAISWF